VQKQVRGQQAGNNEGPERRTSQGYFGLACSNCLGTGVLQFTTSKPLFEALKRRGAM